MDAIRIEKESTDWKKIFAILIPDKWLVSEVYKKLLKLYNKTNCQIKTGQRIYAPKNIC